MHFNELELVDIYTVANLWFSDIKIKDSPNYLLKGGRPLKKTFLFMLRF